MCAVEGCERTPILARGWCGLHYHRWQRTGDVGGPALKKRGGSRGGRSKHGHSSQDGRPSPTYKSWDAMKQRCLNPNATGYEHWGGRGITVCERWMVFENFLEDMGERP